MPKVRKWRVAYQCRSEQPYHYFKLRYGKRINRRLAYVGKLFSSRDEAWDYLNKWGFTNIIGRKCSASVSSILVDMKERI